MNGNGFILESPAPSGGVFSDFISAAGAKLSQLQTRYLSRPADTQATVGSSIFEALYQVGRGKYDAAREKAATALLQSGTGQRFVAEVERQRIQQYLPWIVGASLVVLLFVLIRR